jgi:hypothetical protein
MARPVRAIHFPKAFHILHCFWKMDGRHEAVMTDFI